MCLRPPCSRRPTPEVMGASVLSPPERAGGTLVSARVADADVSRAETALNRTTSVDVATRGAANRKSVWTGFHETAPAYTPDEINRDRASYGQRINP